ncbi:hypothetical protein RchiOBHm_Chr5g0071561 [Rosa chinensis]|uniref:Uncharacterized protein n=1 Tax=Rosa chinensis TaxID=74649 RepID=A0A2P6QKG7_ROSCH|nr:uncharacterized protein LOC112165189 [Rosa chinensis]PRQ34662.1 hypothetical protein RchiOBHm_Chr5g0071561 [Rosa chinensis]
MNATSPNDFMEAVENHSGSDSDTNIDDDDDAADEYYQPVSAVDSEDDEENHHLQNDAVVVSHSQLLPNGVIVNQAQRGVSSLRLNDDVEGDNGSSSEEEEDVIGVGSDSAITRAIREDESRRHAPLTPETATRVMEAMRGISFAGVAPDWADRIPEENWIDRLRRLRQSPQS